MARTPRDKFFSAINEGYDAFYSLFEAGNNRAYRVSRTLLKEAREGEREVVDFARRWADAPTNVFETFASAVDLQARAQKRGLELARDGFAGAVEAGGEVRHSVRKLVEANRSLSEATVDALREGFSLGVRRFRGAEPVEQPAAARPARAKATRRTRAKGKTRRARGRTTRTAASTATPSLPAAIRDQVPASIP